MNRKILIIASVLGLISVVLGAFASHGLKEVISQNDFQTFQVGVRYQMYHALLLLFIGSTTNIKDVVKKRMFWFIAVGLLLFSGSIYGLATNQLTGFDFTKIGFITPIGGLLLIVSWLSLVLNFFNLKEE